MVLLPVRYIESDLLMISPQLLNGLSRATHLALLLLVFAINAKKIDCFAEDNFWD